MLTRRGIIAGAAALGISGAARAQAFPTRPVKLIIPFAPAGGTDIAARLLGERLGEVLGQQIVPDNRPGANGVIAGEALRQSEPDGHTLLVGTAAAFSAAPALGQKIPYDVEKDFAPVAMLGLFPTVLTVSPALGAKTLAEFIARARAEPGKLNYASAGVGGTNHLIFEMFMRATGVRLQHVPYRGAALAVTDLMSGQVQAFVDSLASARPNIEAGKVIALGVCSASRQPQLPDLPTLREQGVDVVYPGWASIVAPAATPAPVISQLNNAVNRALAADQLTTRYRDLVIEPVRWSTAEVADFMRNDRATLTRLVQEAGIKVE
ncbi:MAG: Bug family tripartite tricarboxylate transporter substrate binding protein [Beijerinckiaceae bacterium]